ncbi:uncharacterized protein Z519_08054 [Cladophialophora bantiana CBS 173.52]|uniref:Cytochrome b5 heme-binding domain-containing protein n=1 Tax=Cladophialophora bantiana (strain ATCC 10958 / CBS 173.52 / CDC B-1940 / NIH 8579) TaxID=1442370 RepID=A0A0D2I2P3_CLAB1|nr:uncharacterized protein Z519_08054 [Cladophialophora bantiana CBS 173.52]KIW91159.1 hypothetical protein Z519_08054 [Cladophialophora bantiana CBS 173.52]
MTDPTSPSPYSENKKFEPKVPVELSPPKNDEISLEELSKCDGTNPDKPTWVAIKGTIFDVSKNKAYGEKGQYHGMGYHFVPHSLASRFHRFEAYQCPFEPVFAGKDPSRALALSSLKPEDCVPEWDDLDDKYKTVLDEWYTFFSKRYNIVGKVSTPKLQRL